MYKFPVYWTDKLKIDVLQRIVLTHSYLYYEKDSPVWTDKKYDETCRQLVSLQNNHRQQDIKTKTQYGYAFYDFDGSTGFHLWSRLSRKDKRMISAISERIIKGEQKNEN